MAELTNEQQEQLMLQELSSAGISDDEFVGDMKNLGGMFASLDDLEDEIEGLPPKEQNIARGEALVEIANAMEKYENLPLLYEFLIETFDENDMLDDFQQVLDDLNETSAGIDVSEYESDLDAIKALYERTLNMDGMSDEAKLENYDAVLDEIRNLTFALGADNEADVLWEQFSRYMGIPPDVFPDRMTEYTQLKGEQIGAILKEADDYTRSDARDTLLARGNDAPSDQEISGLYLKHRLDLYQEAKSLDAAFKGDFIIDDTMDRFLENHGKYTVDRIDREIELIELEFEVVRESSKNNLASEPTLNQQPIESFQLADVANPSIPSMRLG